MFEERVSEEREKVPGKKKGLIQAVEDIDDEVVISNRMNIWTRELPIDKYSLQKTNIFYSLWTIHIDLDPVMAKLKLIYTIL